MHIVITTSKKNGFHKIFKKHALSVLKSNVNVNVNLAYNLEIQRQPIGKTGTKMPWFRKASEISLVVSMIQETVGGDKRVSPPTPI